MPKAKTPQRAAIKPRGRPGEVRYLAVALETGGPRLFVDALHNVVRARGKDGVAKAAGVSRREMAQLFSAHGRREVVEILRFMEAAAGKLKIESA